MYLEKLMIYNYRQFGTDSPEEPGITIFLNPQFNLLIGENDSGKTTIIDAIKQLLGSVSDDFEKIKIEDFYFKEGEYSNWFTIEGVFKNLNDEEAGAFLEWTNFDDNSNYELKLTLKVERHINGNGNEFIDKKLFGGPYGEIRLNSAAKELLKTTYLKPLRDAKVELNPGYRSRLAHILKAHPAFKNEETHKLVGIMEKANREIKNYFDEEYEEGRSITGDIKQILENFYDSSDKEKAHAKFNITDPSLMAILRKIGLSNETINLGLGNLNLLFIATELLLDNNGEKETLGPNIILIEEIEAHLHTQAQIRLVKYLEDELKEGINKQFILTTHSPDLIASVNPQNTNLIYDKIAFSMEPDYTALKKEDYNFLKRFLDATKSNLFFAKGVIFVEGYSEMLLLPALAKLIGYPLHKYGVSLVNVGGTSFERYVKLFSRSKKWREDLSLPQLNLPISIVTDIDVKPFSYYKNINKLKSFYIKDRDELEELKKITNNKNLDDSIIQKQYSNLQSFIKENEIEDKFDENKIEKILIKEINECFIEDIKNKKLSNLQQKYYEYNCNLKLEVAPQWTLEYCLALSSLKKLLLKSIHICRYKDPLKKTYIQNYKYSLRRMKNYNDDDIAIEIFKPINNKLVSKAEVSQVLASQIECLVDNYPSKAEILKQKVLSDANLLYLVNAIKHAVGENNG